jgi:hypothetical protein
MKYPLIFAAALGILSYVTAARADIVCTQTGGCFETGMTIISNGSPYHGLEHKPRVMKDGKVRKPIISRTYWD